MAGPNDTGGFRINVPPGSDAVRDMQALVLAVMRGDEEGQQVILDNADLQSLVHVLAVTVAACLTGRPGADPDAPPGRLTDAELQDAEARLITAIAGPDDP